MISLTSKPQRVDAWGFTLTELLIVVSLIGILAGISLSTLSSNRRDERLKAALRETTVWLDAVRSLAIRQDMACQIQINNSLKRLRIHPTQTSDPCQSAALADHLIQPQLRSGDTFFLCSKQLTAAQDPTQTSITCDSSDASTSQTTFTPRGTITDTVLIKASLHNADQGRCIAVVAPLGLIRSGRITNGTCDLKTAF